MLNRLNSLHWKLTADKFSSDFRKNGNFKAGYDFDQTITTATQVLTILKRTVIQTYNSAK